MQMHYRNHFDFIRSITKKNPERKYLCKAPLNIEFHNRI